MNVAHWLEPDRADRHTVAQLHVVTCLDRGWKGRPGPGYIGAPLRAERRGRADVVHPDLGVLGAVGSDHVRVALRPQRLRRQQRSLARQLVGDLANVVVELVADLVRREQRDDHGESGQDHERQRRRAAGEAPADGYRPIRGERSLRRGSYVGAEALHPLQASSVGWRQTPQLCLSSRMGHSPRLACA